MVAAAYGVEVEPMPKAKLLTQPGLDALLLDLPMKPSAVLDPPIEPKFEVRVVPGGELADEAAAFSSCSRDQPSSFLGSEKGKIPTESKESLQFLPVVAKHARVVQKGCCNHPRCRR